MRSWHRVALSMRCGKCGQTLEDGALAQWIRVPGVTRQLCRCEACADSQAPPDLPLYQGKTTKAMRRLEVPDWLKARAGR